MVVRRRRDEALQELGAAVIVGAAGDHDLEGLRVSRRREDDVRRSRRQGRVGAAVGAAVGDTGTCVRAAAGKWYGPGRSFSEKWHQCAAGAHRSPSVRSIVSTRNRCAPITPWMCSAAVCSGTLLRDVKSTVGDELLDAADRSGPGVRAGRSSRCRATGRGGRRRTTRGHVVADVADVMHQDEMRAVGDAPEEAAQHMVGDVIAVRVPEHEHADSAVDDRLEVGRGDVLFARVEAREPCRRHEAAPPRPACSCARRSTGTG